jgi:hypothetical protein
LAQVSAADNHIIEFNASNWQLRNGDSAPMVHADQSGLRYNSHFAMTRRLPATGVMPTPDLIQVVVGWQQSDEAWHMGVVLSPEQAEIRGSRWCEMAHWPDPDRSTFEELAQQSAQGLANALNLPYRFVQPRPATPPAPPPPLPELPLSAGWWTLESVEAINAANYGFHPHPAQMVFLRAARWKRQKYTRMMWYTFWTVIYIALSSATLTSDLALPNAGTLLPDPHVLPYLGFVIAAGLMLLVFYQFYRANAEPELILIDPIQRSISAWRGKHQHWLRGAQDIQSVYVSEIVKKRSEDLTSEHGEINLHLGSGHFQFVLQQGETENRALHRQPTDEKGRRTEEVVQLTRFTVASDLQAMGLYIAEALATEMPCWYDRRVK